MRNRSGRPSSRAIRSILYGGYPSAALATRSSARSISSKPSRNGLDNDGTRAMISKPYDSDFVGPWRRPADRRSTWTSPVRLALIWAIGAKPARRLPTGGYRQEAATGGAEALRAPGARGLVARMERSVIRDRLTPDYAPLHPG